MLAQYEVYPAGFNQAMVASGFEYPTSMAFLPDGRIIVAEQAGRLRLIKNGTLLSTPLLQINVYANGEAGLTGVVVDPDFDVNGYVYVYYTVPGSPLHNRISRFRVVGDQAVAGSATTILDLDPLGYAEQHNGGTMRFGPDGKMYVGVGESRVPDNAQNLDKYLGKLLRINPDGTAPEDNPFPVGSAQRRRIWAYGLRNPFSFSIQPVTGRIYVNDVGEGSWEEIDDATTGGQNFGWPLVEGTGTDSSYTNPVFAYDHTNARCAITGGTFFNPDQTSYPVNYIGKYFYQDLCTSIIHYLTFNENGQAVPVVFGQNLPGQPVGLQVGVDGNLYFLSRHFKALYKIVYASNAPPHLTGQPASQRVPLGQSARFSVMAMGSTPLVFTWTHNNDTIPNVTGPVYTIRQVAAADSGSYRVSVRNAFGQVVSQPASLSVDVPNAPPVATILIPGASLMYSAGDTIRFTGRARDNEDGLLPDSVYVWTLSFHHHTHYHDSPPIAVGKTQGQFVVPRLGETDEDVFYRLMLTVMDKDRGIGMDSIDIHPRLVTLRFESNRPGLRVALNGPLMSTPHQQTYVAGIQLTLSAPASQTVNGITYTFKEWNNPPDSSQTFIVPDTSTTFRVTYQMQPCLVPTATSMGAITDTTAVLSWLGEGATTDTRFTLRWRATADTTWKRVENLLVNNDAGQYALGGLQRETDYEWQVKADCGTDTTAMFSEPVRFRTRGVCQTVKAGSWSDTTVWSCSRVPTDQDIVWLRHSLTVPLTVTTLGQKLIYALPVRLTMENAGRPGLGRLSP